MKFSRIFFVAALLAAPFASAEDISGLWKHADEPGWIEISLDEGRGTVIRNDKFPERVGREILKDLVTEDPEQALWKGLIYAEKLGEYKDAQISLVEPDRMTIKVKVGFMSRTVEWQRVEAVPAKPGS
jgi:uncharacterized protein (DUF2147 family)